MKTKVKINLDYSFEIIEKKKKQKTLLFPFKYLLKLLKSKN